MAPKLLIRTRVVVAEPIAERVKRFVLRPVKRTSMPYFSAGAHVIVQMPNGLRRPYSLCSDPADLSGYEIAVLRELNGHGGSATMHDVVHVGDELLVTFPDNRFSLAQDAEHHILIAGGIGITPILAMVRELSRSNADLVVHYCARSVEHAAYLDMLRTIVPTDRLHAWLSEIPVLDVRGLLAGHRSGDHVYCCGPAGLIEAVTGAAAHWPAGTVHVEKFAALSRDAARQGEPFDVTLTSNGNSLHVPADKSLLEVLRASGYAVDYACEAGACGSCRIAYKDGEPIHRDICLLPEDRHRVLISCVSRARGRLTLDL